MTPESAVTPTADVSTPPASSGNSSPADSSSAPQGSSTPSESTAGTVTADVQGQATDSQPDPFADLPSVEELNTQADQGVKYAKALANLRGVIDPLRTQLTETTEKFQPYQPILDRFEKPEELQSLIDFQSSLTGWENDPQSGSLIPATQAGAEQIVRNFPQHAPYLTSDLLDQQMLDPVSGQMDTGVNIMLRGIAADPAERALALRILGGVEPSSIAPQWQPTPDELAVIAADPANPTAEEKELQNLYRTLPFEKRLDLKENSPEFIRDYLQGQKLQRDLASERDQVRQSQQEQQQRREAYVAQKANEAGDTYVNTQLNQALATFHESVVQQCNFIQPLDPQQLPDGITSEQAQQLNTQIAATNKAEAAQITGLIVSLFNPQTSAYVIPLLKEIGAVDDRLLADLNQAASRFGNNGRNFGHLQYKGQLTANGNGYAPTPDVTSLSNESQRALKTMVAYANQIKGKLLERRSQFFELRARQHNATLNGAPATRPSITGQAYDPTKAAATGQPAGWLSRSQLNQQYG